MTSISTLTAAQWDKASSSQKTFYAWLGYRPYLKTFIENPQHLRLEAIWSRGLAGFLPPDIYDSPSEEDRTHFAERVTHSLSMAKGIGFSDQEIERCLQEEKTDSVASTFLQTGKSHPLEVYLEPFEQKLDPKVQLRKKRHQELAKALCTLHSESYSAIKPLLAKWEKLDRPQVVYTWLKAALFKEYPELSADILQDDEGMEVLINVIKHETPLMALAEARKCPDVSAKNRALANVSIVYLNMELFNEAVEVAREISNDEEKSVVLRKISRELFKRERLEQAFQVAKEIPPGLVDTFGEENRWRSVVLIEIAEEYIRLHQLKEASVVAKEIRNVSARDSVFKSISTAYVGRKLYEEAVQAIREISDGNEEKRKMLERVSEVLLKQKRLDLALQVEKEQPECHRRNVVLACIAREYIKLDKLEEASLTVKEMGGVRNKDRLFKTISSAYADRHWFEQSLAEANNIVGMDKKLKAYLSIAYVLWMVGRSKEAVAVIKEVPETKKTAFLKNLSKDMVKKRRYDDAVAAAKKIPNAWERTKTLESISVFLTGLGRFTAAIIVAKEISDLAAQSNALCDISRTLAEQGHWNEAINTAKEIPLEGKKSCALEDISGVLAGQGHFKEAIAIAKKIPDVFNKVVALQNISKKLLRLQRFVEAVAVAKEIPTSEDQSLALRDIFQVLMDRKHFTEAVAVAKQIPCAWRKSHIFKDVSGTLLSAGRLDEAAAMAKEIPNEWQRSKMLQSISKAWLERGCFDEAFACALEVPYGDLQMQAFKGVFKILLDLQHFDKATILAKKCSDEDIQDYFLDDISLTLLKLKRFKEAFAVAKEISDDSFRADVFSRISRALMDLGRFDAAEFVAKEVSIERERFLILSNISNARAQEKRLREEAARAKAKLAEKESRILVRMFAKYS